MSSQSPASPTPPPTPARRFRPRPLAVVAALLVIAVLSAGAVATLATRDAGEASRNGAGGTVAPAAGDTATPPATTTPEATPTPTLTATPTPEPSPTPTPTPAPTATPSPAPSPESAPASAPLEIRPSAVGNGETLFVQAHAPEADSASLFFRDATYVMTREGEVFFAVVAVPLNATPADERLTVTTRDAAGHVLDEVTAGYSVVAVDRPVDHLTLTEEQGSILTPDASIRERELRAEQFAQFDGGRRYATPFMQPAPGRLTTQFGQGRSINGGPVGGFHSGADIANEEGTPVVAASGARVAWVGEMPIRGNTVILDHGSGVKTGYSHLSQILVEVDQVVERGETIGLMGSTGLSTGPHVHWELTIYGVNVDPFTWLAQDFDP